MSKNSLFYDIQRLPSDIASLILSNLPIGTLCLIFRTNKYWSTISDNENLWRYYCQKLFPETKLEGSWKNTFKSWYAAHWKNELRGDIQLSNNNLTANNVNYSINYPVTTKSHASILCQRTFFSGKHYWEINVDEFEINSAPYIMFGVACVKNFNQREWIGYDKFSISCSTMCTIIHEGTVKDVYESRIQKGDRIGILLDLDKPKIQFYKNGDLILSSKSLVKYLMKKIESGIAPAISLPFSNISNIFSIN